MDILGEYDIFNSHVRDRYRRLERRATFLRQRIFQESSSRRPLSHDQGELSALEWAMRVIVRYYQDHPKEDDFYKPCVACHSGFKDDGMPCEVCNGQGVVIIPPRIRKEKPVETQPIA